VRRCLHDISAPDHDKSGNITAVLQCKWKYKGALNVLGDELHAKVERMGARIYVAVLINNPGQPMGLLPGATL
jgi:hypothetical protein